MSPTEWFLDGEPNFRQQAVYKGFDYISITCLIVSEKNLASSQTKVFWQVYNVTVERE